MRPKSTLACLFLLVGCNEYELSNTDVRPDEPLDSGTAPTTPEPPATTDQTTDPCEGDAPPQILDHRPEMSEILDTEKVVPLEAWVSDDRTPANQLQVEWRLSAGGVLDAVVADDNGYAVGTWVDARATGDQTLVVTVTDSCGNVTETEVPVCQQGGFDVDLMDKDSWLLSGSAFEGSDGSLVLTGPQMWQVGSAFLTGYPVNGSNIEVRFEFLTEGGNGADGMSLTALDTDRFTTLLGGAGCGLGYGGGTTCDGLPVDPPLPGWSVELDTWFNRDIDPISDDHVAFAYDGQVANPLAFAALPELEETGWHDVEVRVAGGRVVVSVGDVVYIDEAATKDLDFPAYIGFTAATGGETNNHQVRGLQVTELICPEGV